MSIPKYRICDCCGAKIELPQTYIGEQLRTVYIPTIILPTPNGRSLVKGNGTVMLTVYSDESPHHFPAIDKSNDSHLQDICDSCKLKMLENAVESLKTKMTLAAKADKQ